MPAMTTQSNAPANYRGDLTIAVLAFGSASAGIVLGGPPLLVALIALAWPLAAFVACNHLAGRGAVMVCLISALSAGMVTTGASPWSAVGLLATIDLMAFAGGLVADRMAPVAAVQVDSQTVTLPFAQDLTFVRSPRLSRRTLSTQPLRVDRSA
jgi:hypothetical protein